MSSLKVPPHSTEAERWVLGAILVDRDAMIQVGNLLVSDDFYDPAHGAIFAAMMDLFSKGRPIDLLTVREILSDRKQLENMGGNAFLADLTNAVFTSANIHQYAQIVKNKAVLRRLIKSGNDILLAGYDEETDVNALLEKAEKALFGVTQTFIQNKLVHIREILNARYEEFAEIHSNPDANQHAIIKSGYASLDHKIMGFRRWDMIIVAARPSMGKTALALNFAQNVAAGGNQVAIFSLEMTKEQLVDRMICAAMGVDSWKLHKWALKDDEFARMGTAIEKLWNANLYLDDSPVGNLIEIKSKARRLKMEKGLDLIVIDYLQLMGGGNPAMRQQEVSDISRGIKGLARELDVPVIALSQLSRWVEWRTDKQPILSDLRESGSIEQDADIVMMLYRDDYYNAQDEFSQNKDITNLFIRKNRNGPVGQVDLKFEKQHMRFYEIEQREHQEQY